MFTRCDRRGDRSRDRSPRRSPRVNTGIVLIRSRSFSPQVACPTRAGLGLLHLVTPLYVHTTRCVFKHCAHAPHLQRAQYLLAPLSVRLYSRRLSADHMPELCRIGWTPVRKSILFDFQLEWPIIIVADARTTSDRLSYHFVDAAFFETLTPYRCFSWLKYVVVSVQQ